MKRPIAVLSALAVLATALAASSASFAQDTTVVQTSPGTVIQTAPANEPVAPPVAERTTRTTWPNAPLIGAGLLTFGLAYVPTIIVASQSSQSADNHLYVPVVGPWLDIANRPTCGTPTGPGCNSESAAKVGIAISGAFQGLGALATVVGLLTPMHHDEVVVTTAAKAEKPRVSVTPTSMGAGGYGLTAVGTW
jgi:hypothetical protein